jgi:hypothetical protein
MIFFFQFLEDNIFKGEKKRNDEKVRTTQNLGKVLNLPTTYIKLFILEEKNLSFNNSNFIYSSDGRVWYPQQQQVGTG